MRDLLRDDASLAAMMWEGRVAGSTSPVNSRSLYETQALPRGRERTKHARKDTRLRQRQLHGHALSEEDGRP